MAKDYLSQNEQFDFIVINGALNIIDKKLENGWHQSADEKKFMKYASTYIDKYLKSVCDRISEEAFSRLNNYNENYKLKMHPDESKYMEIAMLDKNTMQDLIEHCVYKCDTCDLSDVANCSIRIAMVNAFVPPLPRACGGECEYYLGPDNSEVQNEG